MFKGFLVLLFFSLIFTQTAWAQFPKDLLPPSRKELGDTAKARVDTTRFKADSARVADSLKVKADSSQVNELKRVWVTAPFGGSETTTANTVGFEVPPYKSKGGLYATTDSQFVTKALADSNLIKAKKAAGDSARDAAGDSVAALRVFAHLDSLNLRNIKFPSDTTGHVNQIWKMTSPGVMVWANDNAGAWTSGDSQTVRNIAAPMIHDSLAAGGSSLDTLPGANKTGDGGGGILWGVAAAITRPGFFYYISGVNTWTIADTSVARRARGMAMDSVAAGATCKFMFKGTYRLDSWNWTPGVAIFSDSVTAGKPNVGGQTAPKKMQNYGQALSATVIFVDINSGLAY